MKYYLFVIRDNHKYENDAYLYSMLESLKLLNSENYNYGFSLYHSLCYFFNDTILKNYIDKKYHLKFENNIYYLNDETSFAINKSCCWIKTNKHLKELLCIFYIYHKNIFVCNFDTNEYFWIRDKFRSNCIQ